MISKFASPQSDFESSFFQLAYEKLQEKLNNLLQYLVGFEVVNKTDDGTKALGVFGFKSDNGQILFVPAFFVNGVVRDLDLLYSKNNEQFYPLNEDWAELFMKDDITGLGSVGDTSKQEIQKDMPAVDFRNFVVPPRTGKISLASVIDYVADSDNMTKQAFMGLMENEKFGADFTEAMLRYYDLEKIAAALTPKSELPRTKVNYPVDVITQKDTAKAKSLSAENKKQLMSKGYVILDNRDPAHKSKAGIFQFAEKFTNPSSTGFYTYLTTQGALRHGIIFRNPITFYMGFPSDDVQVLDLDSTDGKMYTKPYGEVFTKDQVMVKDLKPVLDMMVDPSEGKPGFNDKYILVNEHLKCTVPFRIAQNFKDGNGVRRIVVSQDCCSDREKGAKNGTGNRYYEADRKVSQDVTLVFTKKNSNTLEFRGNQVYCPKGFKLLKVDLDTYGDNDAKNNAPGGMYTLHSSLLDKNVFPLTVNTNGSEYFVSVAAAKKRYANPVEAKIAMVVDLGLDEKLAEEIIDSIVTDKVHKGYIKLAYTGDEVLMPPEEQATNDEQGIPTTYGVPSQLVGDTSDGYTGNPARPGIATTQAPEGIDAHVQHAIELANGGQKEIFDTQMIATLSKYVNPSEKVNNYVPEFVTALDKLGRLIFLINWETDKFQQMYGRDELPELSELLKNVFKNLGDLVIFLKNKSPELSINGNSKDPASALI